jgi:hypothetical protein
MLCVNIPVRYAAYDSMPYNPFKFNSNAVIVDNCKDIKDIIPKLSHFKINSKRSNQWVTGAY